MQSSPSKLKPALIAGAALGIASAIPFLSCLNCLCCALVVMGGFLASYLYLQEASPSLEPPYGDGAIVGALAGIVGAVISTIMQIPISLMTSNFGLGGDPDEILRALEDAGVDVPAAAEQFVGNMVGGGVSIVGILLSLFFGSIIFSIFGMLGGILGVTVLHKKPPTVGYSASPPPPPPAV